MNRNSSSREWRSALDQKSGRTYYYNIKTKETTWSKPIELASPEEQREMIEKRNETINFFKEMEENIRKKLIVRSNEGEDSPKISYSFSSDSSPRSPRNRYDSASRDSLSRPRFNSGSGDGRDLLIGAEGRSRLDSFGGAPPRRIRTISTMDDEILLTMRQFSNDDSNRRMVFNSSNIQSIEPPYYIAEEKENPSNFIIKGSKDTNDKFPLPINIESKDVAEMMDDNSKPSPNKKSKLLKDQPNSLKRRNSTGTIYIANTMSKQNNDATILCVCVVIRAHMIQAAKENIEPLPQYDVFKDTSIMDCKLSSSNSSDPLSLIPTLNTVKEFFMLVFSKSQLESDCIIMALIYCERLVKETKGRLSIRYDNWKSILFACLVMASKVWDDLSMWNVDFSHVYPTFDLARVNSLELAMLEALKYVIRVSASEYAKYYFHLRSLMTRLGLDKGEPNSIHPLDIDGARKLQLSTEKYEELSSVPRRRIHSIHGDIKSYLQRNISLESYQLNDKNYSKPVMLEQITHQEHMDADGQVHIKKNNKTSSKNVLPPNFRAESKPDNSRSDSKMSKIQENYRFK